MKQILYVLIALCLISAASAEIQITMTDSQKMIDQAGNSYSGKVTYGSPALVTPAKCGFWCQIKNFFGFQAIVSQGGELPEGYVLKIGDYLPVVDKQGNPIQKAYSASELDRIMYTDITYREKDGNIYTGRFTQGTSLDMTALDPQFPVGVSGKADKSVVLNIPPPNLPTPAGCIWILEGGSGTLSCETGNFFQAGPSETYYVWIDTANGLDIAAGNNNYVFPKGANVSIKVKVTNKIAEGLDTGIIYKEYSKTYLTSTNIEKLGPSPSAKNVGKEYAIPVDTSKIGDGEISAAGFAHVQVPYVRYNSGLGGKPEQAYEDWYGTDDQELIISYRVVFPEQIGELSETQLPYKSPYSMTSGSELTLMSAAKKHSNIWMWLLFLAIITGITIFFVRRFN